MQEANCLEELARNPIENQKLIKWMVYAAGAQITESEIAKMAQSAQIGLPGELDD